MKRHSGQSFIEVIVALGMMSLLLVALLALMSLSVRNSRQAQTQTRALALAQTGVELMRAYRDYSWTLLEQEINNINAYNLPENWVVADGLSAFCDTDNYTISSIFSRCVKISLEEIDLIQVVATVYWQEGGQQHSVQQLSRLSKWER